MNIKLIENSPSILDYMNLREKAGLSPRSQIGVEIGLKNTWYGVYLINDKDTIGMGRIIGDGGTTFQIVDIAILPEYQGQGLGKLIMDNLMSYYIKNSPSKAYLNLIADGDAKFLYKKYDFEEVEPVSVGMSFKITN